MNKAFYVKRKLLVCKRSLFSLEGDSRTNLCITHCYRHFNLLLVSFELCHKAAKSKKNIIKYCYHVQTCMTIHTSEWMMCTFFYPFVRFSFCSSMVPFFFFLSTWCIVLSVEGKRPANNQNNEAHWTTKLNTY